MAKEWQEYDPLTGVHEHNVGNDWEDKVTVHKSQHMQGLLDRNAYLRNTGATDAGIKKGIWHYCSIPIVVQYELLSKYGLNIHNKNHTDRIFQVVNRDYPYLKTTNKTHSRGLSPSPAKESTPKLGKSPSIILST
jgi:hypothetical protein